MQSRHYLIEAQAHLQIAGETAASIRSLCPPAHENAGIMKLMDQLAHEQAAQLAEMRGNIAAIKSLTLHIRDFRKQARLRIRRLKTQKS